MALLVPLARRADDWRLISDSTMLLWRLLRQASVVERGTDLRAHREIELPCFAAVHTSWNCCGSLEAPTPTRTRKSALDWLSRKHHSWADVVVWRQDSPGVSVRTSRWFSPSSIAKSEHSA